MWGKKYYYAGQKFLASSHLNFRHNTIMKTMMKWWSWIARKRSVYIQFFMILVSSGRRHDLLRVRYYMIILSALPRCEVHFTEKYSLFQREMCLSAGPLLCLWLKAAGLLKWVLGAKIRFTSLTSHRGLSLSHFWARFKIWQSFWQKSFHKIELVLPKHNCHWWKISYH